MRSLLTILGVTLAVYLFASNNESFTPVNPYNVNTGLYDAIIDVRTLREYNDGHLKNAILLEDLHKKKTVNDLLRVVPNKDSKLLFYCKSGRRAKLASKVAEAVGYKNIDVVTNGGYVDLRK